MSPHEDKQARESLTVTGRPKNIVQMPPSKSVAHRALICAALAPGASLIQGLTSLNQDILATLDCLSVLGVVHSCEADGLRFSGLDWREWQGGEAGLMDCRESGSTLRFILPLVLYKGREQGITGAPRLWQRPQQAYLEALAARGGDFSFEEDSQILRVKGILTPGPFQLPGHISSQYVSGLLMVLPLLEGDSLIRLTSGLESRSYVDITLAVMKDFGVEVENANYQEFRIKGRQSYQARSYQVEGDYSAAAFFLAAGALGCDIACAGLREDSPQGDRAVLDIIAQCGGRVERENGLVRVAGGSLHPLNVDCRDIPDLVPPLAALLMLIPGQSRILGASRLRMKESDRLSALAGQFRPLGADIQETEDGLLIRGVESLAGGLVDPQNDHRIAMAAALASLRSEGPVQVLDYSCVKKSYPNFWEDFMGVGLKEKNHV